MDKTGYLKITASCKQAERDGWEYVWIDTCCIDKTSSAELSEAINSMFRWYQRAQICYAYMVDVDIHPSLPEVEDPNQLKSFRRSRWFTRGWTLQELLAPGNVIFFDREWRTIGNKSDLRRDVSSATSIQSRYIVFPKEASVAAKMSWASKRSTTRAEDWAYCLLGLFDVNMPLLYGEGHEAFIRLQHEIFRVNPDESLFAWRVYMGPSKPGMFALTPEGFADSGNIVPSPRRSRENVEPMSVTNRGLATRARLWVPEKGIEYFDFRDKLSEELFPESQNNAQESSIKVDPSLHECFLLSCTLNYKPAMAISLLIRQQSPNSLGRDHPEVFLIHHPDDALRNRSKNMRTMFVELTAQLPQLMIDIRPELPWVRLRRAPFGRQFSLIHYHQFEDAAVLRASSRVRRQQRSWDTIIETPIRAQDLWFCTEDNDLFVIANPHYRMETHVYQGKYIPDQSYSKPATDQPNDTHWKPLSWTKGEGLFCPSKLKWYYDCFYYGQLPSSSYISIRKMERGAGRDRTGRNREGGDRTYIDVVVDKRSFSSFPDPDLEDSKLLDPDSEYVEFSKPSRRRKLKSSVVNALFRPSPWHLQHRR